MSSVELAVAIVVVWSAGLPVLTLLHKLGHAVAALALTRSPVHVRVGAEPPLLRLAVGRLTLALHPWRGWIGFASWYSLGLVLVTAWPMRYPSWWGAYAGFPSDGLRAWRGLRGEIESGGVSEEVRR
jgi:hypothetical protein